MSVSVSDFWKLVAEARLLSIEQCRKLRAAYDKSQAGGDSSSAQALAKWLIAQKRLTRYQAAILLGGRSGPFFYGPYKLYDRLDRGPLTGLFRAVHVPSRHVVLLQFLTGPDSQETGRWPAIARRTAELSPLDHPQLQGCFEAVADGAYKFVVREYLPGQAAEQHVAERGRVGPKQAGRLIYLAALGLGQLHQAGCIHGHVRPSSIWIHQRNPENGVGVKLLMDPTRLPEPWTPPAEANDDDAETADYLAPELAQPGKQPDRLTDIYALGCTFYYLLSGRVPFAGGTAEAKLRRHATEPIEPLDKANVPPAIAQIVAFMMAKNAAVRYATAEVVVEKLAAVLDTAALKPAATLSSETLPGYQSYLHKQRSSHQPDPSQVALAGAGSAGASPSPASTSQFGSAGASPSQASPSLASPPQTEPSLDIKIQAPPPTARLARRRSARSGYLIAGIAALVALLLIGGTTLWFLRDSREPIARKGPEQKEKTDVTIGDDGTDQEGGDQQRHQLIVPDDGQLLWASPTAGSPLELAYVPPGGQLFLVARPAEILASQEGQRVIKALGPDLQEALDGWEATAGVVLENVRQIIVTWHPVAEGAPRVSHVVELIEPVEESELLAAWGNPAAQSEGETTYYAGSSVSFFIPKQQRGRLFLMGAAAEVAEVVRFQGAPPPLQREIEHLRLKSDDQRQLNLLFSPHFMATDGQNVLPVPYDQLVSPLRWFLGDGLKGTLLSAHVDELFYAELRLFAALDRDAQTVASQSRDRVAEAPDRVESYLASALPHPYWRRVGIRYPQMVRTLNHQLRAGVEDDQAVLNCVLPSSAAHNLVFGAVMMLSSSGDPVLADSSVAAQPAGPTTLDAVLQAPLDLAFAQQSLEEAMQDVAMQVTDAYPALEDPFTIRIVGEDLQKEGITRNQQIRDFALEAKTVAELLTALVMKANPVTTVTNPAETDQKLVWVVANDPQQPGRNVVLITTRQAARQQGYDLPSVFEGT